MIVAGCCVLRKRWVQTRNYDNNNTRLQPIYWPGTKPVLRRLFFTHSHWRFCVSSSSCSLCGSIGDFITSPLRSETQKQFSAFLWPAGISFCMGQLLAFFCVRICVTHKMTRSILFYSPVNSHVDTDLRNSVCIQHTINHSVSKLAHTQVKMRKNT